MMRKEVLFPGILFFLAVEQVCARAGLFQKGKSYSLPPSAQTHAVNTQHTESGTTTSSKSTLVTGEKSNKGTAEDANTSNEVTPEERGLSGFRKAISFSIPFRRLSLFSAVLLIVCLNAALTTQAAAPAEQDDDRLKELKARLGRVKALLPAAETLALAVDSEEAQNLLKTLRNSIGEKDTETQEAEEVERLETSVAKALRTLRSLYHAALKEADAIMQVDRLAPGLPTLGFTPEAIEHALVDIEALSEQQVTRPLIRTYRSLLRNGAVLTNRIQKFVEKLNLQRPFQSEVDEEVLFSTACALEALRATSASRKRLTHVGQELAKVVIEGVKLGYVQYHERALLDIEGELQLIHLRFLLRKKAADASKGSAVASPLRANEKEGSLDDIKNAIKSLGTLMTELRSYVKELRASTWLPHVAAMSNKLHNGRQEASALLVKCSQIEDSLYELPTVLDKKSHLLAVQIGTSNAQSVQKEKGRLTQSLQKLREMMTDDDSKKVSARKLEVLSELMFTSLIKTGEDIAFEADKRTSRILRGVENLKKVKDVWAAVDELSETRRECLSQRLDKGKLDTLELGAQLVMFLESDVSHSITQVDKLSPRACRLSGDVTHKYKKLRGQFIAAKGGVKNAWTLLEAANAAADVRSHLSAMEELLLPTNEVDQP